MVFLVLFARWVDGGSIGYPNLAKFLTIKWVRRCLLGMRSLNGSSNFLAFG
ncbi:MAG: hypothetical protein O4804_04175 [Trichodesmium sp. St11_bin5]|nr:hypothetical protein [Trichodesmium sp. St11_bin5]MDT9338460.1 hypothetical protein [Trichodesmium erythraeum 21-75]